MVWRRLGDPSVRKVSFGVSAHPSCSVNTGLVSVGDTRKMEVRRPGTSRASRMPIPSGPSQPYRTGRKTLSGPEIASVTTFQPALPSRTRRSALRMAFRKANSRVRLEGVLEDDVQLVRLSGQKDSSAQPTHLHPGDAGWEDRIAIRGRPKAASRRGRSPQEAALLLSLFARCYWSGIGRSYPQASLPQNSPLGFRFKYSS